MNFEVVFLGTSAAVPSATRAHAAIAIKYFNEIILFDCGEGTQRQLISSKTSYMKINHIFITHYHGDHFLGLPGLLQTMSLSDRTEPLTIYGPRGINDVLDAVIRICRTELSFEIIPREIKAGPVHVTDKFRIDAVKVDHSALTYGLVFEEVKKREFLREIAISLGVKPGPDFSRLHRGEEITVDGKTIRPDNVLGGEKKCKKVVYTSDTRPCQNIIDASKDAVLIHDSTYDGSMKDQAAEATHSTSIEAAEVAARGGAKKLFLIHISPRYSSTVELLKEAKTVFAATSVARDFQVYKP